MNRELEVLEWLLANEKIYRGRTRLPISPVLSDIKQRLEVIDYPEPSVVLMYVNAKIANLEDDLQHYTMVDKDKCREFFIREDLKQFTNIKQALLKTQKQEKALEIIFEKNVDILELRVLIEEHNDKDALSLYNSERGIILQLTQEELELLKRWLKNE